MKFTQSFPKTFRSAAVGIGIVAMLSLSACGNPGSTPPQPSPAETSNSSESASATPSESSSTEGSPSSEASSSKKKDGKDLPYLIPLRGSTTLVGEPVEEAEARFIKAAKAKDTTGMSDKELLDTGYEVCGYYFNSENLNEVFDRIETASEGSNDKEVFLIRVSGWASHTLCPEYAEFE